MNNSNKTEKPVSEQLYLPASAKITLNSIIEQDLIRNGMSPEDVALQSSTGLMIAGFNTIFDNVNNIMNNIKRESSLTTARYSSSLYTQLVQHETEITISQPAKLRMFVKVPVQQIKNKGKLVQANTYEVKFTKDNVVEIDGQDFIPEIPVHYMRYTVDTNTYDLRVFYKDKFGASVNIPTQSLYFGGVRYLIFAIDFVQLTIETFEKTFSDTQLDTFIVSTKDPIHDFRLFYKDDQASEETEVHKRLFYTRGQGSFMQYKILSNNSVRIDHKYVIGGFKPSVGGILRIECYTTTGQNTKYRGLAKVKKSVPIDLGVEYYPIDDDTFESTGGRLASNDKEYIRNYIMKLKGSRRRIDTEFDMGIWLQVYEGSSKFKPQLVINNVLTRIWNVYTVLSFSHMNGTEKREFTVPTNTLTMNIPLDKLPNNKIQGFTWYCITPDNCMRNTYKEMLIENTYDPDIDTSTFKPQIGDSYYYVSPFIYSYSADENFCRSYADAQYNVPYTSRVIYESPDEDIPTRFINSTMRMNDYIDDDTQERVFRITAQIRSDNPDFKPNDGNFISKLRFLKIDEKNWLEIEGKVEVANADENKYNLIFDLKCDRKVWGTYTNIEVNSEKTPIHVRPKIELSLFAKIPDKLHPEQMETVKVVTYTSNLELFRELTATNNIQTNMNSNGNMDFLLMPLVSLEFYQRSQNKRKIIDEINRVSDFLNQEIYTEYDMFASKGLTLRDVQETLFTTTIKFAKTYGRSKFLNVSAQASVPINNLQLKPTLYIRKVDPDFDESAISSQINKTLITHDYSMTDLHMSDLVTEVMTEAEDAVSILQFVNFDQYPANYHMIERNEVPEQNDDPPEVVSLEPIWNDESKSYEYNILYAQI